MRLKKYIAHTAKEAMEMMRQELGDDAVILSTRTAKKPGSVYGECVEIVAALDESLETVEPPRPAIITPKLRPAPRPERQEAVPARKSLPQPEESAGSVSPSQLIQQAAAYVQLQEEIKGLRDMMLEMNDSVRYRYSGALGPMYGRIYKELREADVNEELALSLTGQLSARGPHRDFALAVREARQLLLEKLSFGEALRPSDGRNVIMCVGPTGSGKTSTVSKLAAISKLIYKANVLLISADTYKVGGADQLQTFASIAAIPCYTAYSTQELRQMVRQEVHRDFIFIDTVGKSHLNKGFLQDLAACQEAATPDRTYLVQSATTSESTFYQVLKNFALLQPSGLILTKFDEAASIGGVYSALCRHPLPMVYYANGQTIPDDIEPAQKDFFAKKILPQSLELE